MTSKALSGIIKRTKQTKHNAFKTQYINMLPKRRKAQKILTNTLCTYYREKLIEVNLLGLSITKFAITKFEHENMKVKKKETKDLPSIIFL